MIGGGTLFLCFPVFRAEEPRIWELKLPFPNFSSPDGSPQAHFWGWVSIPSDVFRLCDGLAHRVSAESRLLYLPLQILFLNLGFEPSALSTGPGAALHRIRPLQQRLV